MKWKNMSKSTLSLIIVIAMLFVSMIGVSLVQTNGWSVKETTFTGTLSEVAAQITENTDNNGKVVDILFDKNDSAQISFTMYVPKNATASNPAPVIVCAHGWNNSKEMQLSNFTELARRGYVVIAFDLSGHGRSDIEIDALTQGTEGMLAVVEYAMSLDFVDITKVGITGHSAGDLACTNTLKVVNTVDAVNHIAAFFCPSGTMAALLTSGDATTNLIWGVASGRYDELDTFYFGTYDFLSSPIGKMLVKRAYPAFSGDVVVEGQYYTADGPIDTPAPGEALGVTSAFAVWNPDITHPQGTFSKIATELTIDFFYAAFGTPNGGTYIAATNQVWQMGVVFQTIGLLAFFASALVIGGMLLKTRQFATLTRTIAPQKELPSIKSWKEWLPLVLTFIPLLIFPYVMYFKCYAAAGSLFNTDIYSMTTVNGIAWFTLVSGLFCFLMLAFNYGLKKLVHLKDGEAVANPFMPGKLDSVTHFLKIVGYSALVVVLMYVPCYIAYNVFHMNFGIAVYTVGLPRFEWLPTILTKYLPFWIAFLLPNAILNADTRFKEVPEWASTLFVAIANVLPIVVLTIVNYSSLVNTGVTKFTFGDPSIMTFNLFAPMIFIAITGRYFYKKTGNAWSGAFIAATVLALMALTLTRHTSSLMFGF